MSAFAPFSSSSSSSSASPVTQRITSPSLHDNDDASHPQPRQTGDHQHHTLRCVKILLDAHTSQAASAPSSAPSQSSTPITTTATTHTPYLNRLWQAFSTLLSVLSTTLTPTNSSSTRLQLYTVTDRNCVTGEPVTTILFPSTSSSCHDVLYTSLTSTPSLSVSCVEAYARYIEQMDMDHVFTARKVADKLLSTHGSDAQTVHVLNSFKSYTQLYKLLIECVLPGLQGVLHINERVQFTVQPVVIPESSDGRLGLDMNKELMFDIHAVVQLTSLSEDLSVGATYIAFSNCYQNVHTSKNNNSVVVNRSKQCDAFVEQLRFRNAVCICLSQNTSDSIHKFIALVPQAFKTSPDLLLVKRLELRSTCHLPLPASINVNLQHGENDDQQLEEEEEDYFVKYETKEFSTMVNDLHSEDDVQNGIMMGMGMVTIENVQKKVAEKQQQQKLKKRVRFN